MGETSTLATRMGGGLEVRFAGTSKATELTLL